MSLSAETINTCLFLLSQVQFSPVKQTPQGIVNDDADYEKARRVRDELLAAKEALEKGNDQ